LSKDLTFSVMIDSPLDEAQLLDAVTRRLHEAERVGGYVRYKNNMIKPERNSLHDRAKVLERDNKSWKYYKYSLSVFPEGNVTLEGQKKVASEILIAVRGSDMPAELVAEFDV
jgi:hypothetical protein